MTERFKPYYFKAFYVNNNLEPLITTKCSETEEVCPVLVYGKKQNMNIQEGFSLKMIGFYKAQATDKYIFKVVGVQNQLKQNICDICNECQTKTKTR